ncbi:pectate lyase [Stieleria sp. TO1_6]|uniref:right-handed parallel beta-helix repeat-containing protein n=1 Tax=Stieleria tagensis TaxID=2956795 RepID=UPI00209AF6D4|nr:pectate lyase [Stieleria tagensis]MCO8124192.1 pectate lyase [Stieleria tagensis]
MMPTSKYTLSQWLVLILIVLAGFKTAANAETYYVATDGDDRFEGTVERPFATIQHAQQHVSPGDTVFIRGGRYIIQPFQIALKRRIWAHVIRLDKSGSPGKRINYWAYPDEQPVFDFSNVKPAGLRVHAFSVSGSWIHLKGLEVVGVQVTIKSHTQSICFANDGSHNLYEQLSMHDGQAIGLYSVKGSDNLFLNCDAYRNDDPVSEGGHGGNVDGFGCHPDKGSTGNVFRGCRAWFNSDDGFDCISAFESVTFENCWAFWNGYSPEFKRRADGNGFKVGGYGSRSVNRLPVPIPRHTTRFCVAVHNKNSGFYANHHIGGSDWINNTAYANGANFNMLSRLDDNVTDVDGYGHLLRNNLSHRSRALVTKLDRTACDVIGNSFDSDIELTAADFLSLEESQLLGPRRPDGGLPEMAFLHLAAGNSLVDRGLDHCGAFVTNAGDAAGKTPLKIQFGADLTVPGAMLVPADQHYDPAIGYEGDPNFDATHHSSYGAYELAHCVMTGLGRAGVTLADHRVHDVDEFDPAAPDRWTEFSVPPSPGRTNLRPLGD